MPDLNLARWTMELWTRGEQVALTHWEDVSVTWNLQGATSSVSLPASMSGELIGMVPLVTDLVMFRDKKLMFRLRVVDVEDSLSRNGHVVTMSCESFETLLTRRILWNDVDATRDQHEWLRWLIDEAQSRESFGIDTSKIQRQGTDRSRVLRRGATIAEAINDVAGMEGGFDWWITPDLVAHAQTPRRSHTIDDSELTWGSNVAEITRSLPIESYASDVLGIGSTEVVTLPSGTTYQPPAPHVASLPQRPYGRWETMVSWPDVVTQPSLDSKTRHELSQLGTLRAEYTLTLEPWAWLPEMTPGAIIPVRIDSPPRLNKIHDTIRIEEVALTVRADGDEQVQLAGRSEASASALKAGSAPSGLSRTTGRVHPLDRYAAVVRSLDGRMRRLERS